ncbi:putative kinesin heavy chain protein [Phaeoacremonium minimum UCRPA7]|uniref:Kinesin-like protein n=1 Tax=Phaeoacremonium minimum (strain UCR-PA7) TaxID=1286976 RepID=R8BQ44_PHAM7|nr:putative kinesin heavy chain protein [Phaeoacremonium minimum UCRPA7]EOO01454.1 putative kinesin heavy chain protein [Phaeoacremonium minimum UCRPA7]
MSTTNSIKVVARFRPQNRIELDSGGQPIVRFDGEDTCTIDSREAQGSFTFDRVFDMSCKQSDIFDFSIRSTVEDILNGYNGTVFAYGQTGAGKSYTMMGTSIDDDEGRGVIPRIVEQIFDSIMSSPGTIEYTVRVSYMEIYMERIRDLLQPQNDNLPVHEEKNRGVYVKGLLEIYVSSVQEVFEVMRRGGNARAVAATNMNQESSRSHSIFVITITQKNVETGSAKSGQLYLVDLAGSEKVGKTGASGQTLEEAKKINKSLSALGMVINSLTDGKSSHIPYRDSKLTRILQESLGGNSRTTLIINCSPSSYNDAETLSTLRFGMRAKSIKNKAKINAELSPAELKALLAKAKTQITTFENYIVNLEGELQLWRAGESVSRDRWVQPLSADALPAPKSQPARPSTPSRLAPESRAETPAISERAGTPSLPLDKDEREEFLRRENELQDQLSEKESLATTAEKHLREAKEELNLLKEHDSRVGKDNERLNSEVNEVKMQLERLTFEGKEAQITMDALKEANSELTAELDEVKQQLLDVKMSAKETSAVLDEKERKKAEKMAKMMAGFDLGGEVFSDNERQIAEVIDQVDALHEQSSTGDPIPPDDLKALRAKLVATQGIVRQAELSLYSGASSDSEARRRAELEARLEALQQEYEDLLTRNLGEGDAEEIKSRLAQAFADRQNTQVELVDDLRADITRKVAENERMKVLIEDLQRQVKAGTAAPMANGKTIAQQMAEFDVMKKSLMRDLQNRCERVVELEISLDETREQYNNVLRSSNNRAQQKKMAFLERNLEQLTQVQRQLVEQNSGLKKEVAIAERKLIARNERIQSLESLLQDSQEKMAQANHKFEVQLAAVKERLEAAKAGSTRGLNSPTGLGGFNFANAGSRIAKPLRGGGGDNTATNPAIANLQGGGENKRSSWFFQKS